MKKLPRFTAEDLVKMQSLSAGNWDGLCKIRDGVNDRLEEFEKSCVRVYGRIDGNVITSTFGGIPTNSYQQQALLFNIEPIEQAVSTSEIVKCLRENRMNDIADRLVKFGIKG